MSRSLRSIAGALRRRGLWLVFGAIGGLIGGSIVASSTKPQVIYKRYYKATAGMRLAKPVNTSQAANADQLSLRLAQLAVASPSFREAVATETGVSTGHVKNHLIAIAFDDTATMDLTVVTNDPIRAEQMAYHAAQQLNPAIAQRIQVRSSQDLANTDETLRSLNELIIGLKTRLEHATGDERTELRETLASTQDTLNRLRDQRKGAITSPPVFVLSSQPTAIRINSHAYITRWAIASNDLGTPRIQTGASLMNIRSGDDSKATEAARALLSDTELPQPKSPPPVQPISIGLLAGLLLGLSGVVLGEAWDERIRDSVQAAKATGMNIIVEIPRLSRRQVRGMLESRSDRTDAKVDDANVRFREAAWVITSALGIDPRPSLAGTSSPGAPDAPKAAPMILVTSTSPAEGKSTSTAALAIALGQLGFRVLAVDGDYHHRSLAGLIRPIPTLADPNDPVETMHIGVWHMDDPESTDRKVTSSKIVARLVRRAMAQRQNFDVILIDTPPVSATTDAIEFLQYADAAVLIVRLEQTPAPALRMAANSLLRHGMITPGVIVTDVPPGTIDQYRDLDD